MAQVFGKYRLIRKLGTGGMAEVFLGHPSNMSRQDVAIKRILPQFSQSKPIVKMLIQEASLGMALNHPNIVKLFDFGLVNQMYFIAMEYVDGEDLKSVILKLHESDQRIPVPIALKIACDILRGLDYAHTKVDHYQRPLNIIHRDISPQNIILSYDGEVKILDFGIAKPTAKPEAVAEGTLKGKLAYMSPEQASVESLDARSDIFSLGILLWELLTHRPLFTGSSQMEVISKVRKAEVIPPHLINSNIPEALSKIVMKALQLKPSQRWDSAQEMHQKLYRFLIGSYGKVSQSDLLFFLYTVFKDTSKAEEIKEKISALKSKENIEPQSFFDPHSDKNRVSKKKFSPWVVRKKKPSLYIFETVWILCLLLVLVKGFSTPYPSKSYARSLEKQLHNWLLERHEIPKGYPALELYPDRAEYKLSFSRRAQITFIKLPFAQQFSLHMKLNEKLRNHHRENKFSPPQKHIWTFDKKKMEVFIDPKEKNILIERLSSS